MNMKNVIISVLIALIAMMIISCGTKTETTAETSAEESSVTVATQQVLGEESASTEETVVVETGEESVSVKTSSDDTGVSVDVSTDTVSVDVEQEDQQTKTSDESTETIEVKIENYAFDEKTITVKADTTVVWENYDSAAHTVTGDGLDSGKLSKGDTYEYTFTEPGTYEYYCAYHPSMTGTVIVE